MAAGLGFKTFTTGEVLTAADVNGYLMQGVLVFASEAARNSAITSPQEGQFAYTKDNNSLWYYTGSAWAASGATGDIEGVTAGVGISGGGTSGTVTITNSMATEITAAGDIVVGTGSGTFDNLPIGSTGQVLTADTTVSPYKVKWAAPGGGSGMTLITRQVISASSGTNIDSVFSSTYINYFITIDNINGSTGSNDLQLQLRYGTTTQVNTHYKYFDLAFGGTLASTEYTADFVTLTPNLGGTVDGSFVTGYISKVGNSSQKPQFQLQLQDQSSGVPRLLFGKVNDEQTYTGIRLIPSAGTFSGTVSIYGLAKS